MTVTVAIDCMGGDHGPHVTVAAALDFLRKHDDVRVILVGIEDKIRPFLLNGGGERALLRHASEVVSGQAAERVRTKKNAGAGPGVLSVVRV